VARERPLLGPRGRYVPVDGSDMNAVFKWVSARFGAETLLGTGGAGGRRATVCVNRRGAGGRGAKQIRVD